MDNYGTKSNKLHFAKDFKKSEVIKKEMADGGRVKKYAIVDENTDRIYIKNTNKEFIDLKFKELKEVYPNDKLSIVEFAHGGYMAKGGGIYTTDSLYYLQVIKDDKEVAREKFRAKSLKEAKEIAEEEYESNYISKYGNPLNFIVSEAMENGGKLIGNQKKLDVNKNGKLDAQDFKMLRGKMAMGGEIKMRSERDSIKLAKEYQKVLDSDFDDKVYDKYQKLVKDTQIPKGELQKIEHYISTTPKGKRRDIDTFRYWGVNKMAMGGKVKFADKVKEVKASLLKRKKVSPKVQKDYGKTYSPKEAEQSAKRIIGAQVKKYEVKKK
jgi:hypothetical protein